MIALGAGLMFCVVGLTLRDGGLLALGNVRVNCECVASLTRAIQIFFLGGAISLIGTRDSDGYR